MGPNETAITLIGGPRVISVFDVHGWCRAQIKHFFGVLIGSRTPYGLGLMVSRRLHRIRMRFGPFHSSQSSGSKTLAKHPWRSWTAERIDVMIQAAAYAV